MLNTLSYSSLQLWADCRYSWFGRYILGRSGEGNVKMWFGTAMDIALSTSNEHKRDHGTYLEPEIVAAIFREELDTALEDNPYPGILAATLDLFWLGEDPVRLRAAGDDLIALYYSEPWVEDESEDSFLPLTSAAKIQPEGIQLKLTLPLPGDNVTALVGVLDLLDAGGTVVDFKTSTSGRAWAAMDNDLQPTTYAALMGEPITFQYIELIRGARKNSIESHSTVRTQEDINRFTEYVLMTAREIDSKLSELDRQLPGTEWHQDPEAIRHAATIFLPSPGRRCMWDGHFNDCAYRAGVPEE